MEKKVELKNIEIGDYCLLDIQRGDKEFNRDNKRFSYFTGFYFKDAKHFLQYILQKKVR